MSNECGDKQVGEIGGTYGGMSRVGDMYRGERKQGDRYSLSIVFIDIMYIISLLSELLRGDMACCVHRSYCA